jgi:hypothetical protein
MTVHRQILDLMLALKPALLRQPHKPPARLTGRHATTAPSAANGAAATSDASGLSSTPAHPIQPGLLPREGPAATEGTRIRPQDGKRSGPLFRIGAALPTSRRTRSAERSAPPEPRLISRAPRPPYRFWPNGPWATLQRTVPASSPGLPAARHSPLRPAHGSARPGSVPRMTPGTRRLIAHSAGTGQTSPRAASRPGGTSAPMGVTMRSRSRPSS